MATQRAKVDLDLTPLRRLDSKAKQRSITLKAVKAGAKLVQGAAKARAPKLSGAMRQSLGVKSGKGKRGKTTAYAVIGARKKVVKMVSRTRGGKKIAAKPSKYLHLVEKGTKPHGGHPGSRPAPFLRPALDAVKGRAAEAGMRVVAEEIDKALAKQASKTKG